MYRIVICDEESDFIKYMKKIILQCDVDEEEVEFYCFLSGKNFLERIKAIPSCELLFLGAKLGEEDGFEVATEFRKVYPSAILVYCSGEGYPADEIFKTSPYRFLRKNYPEQKMLGEVHQIIGKMKEENAIPVIFGKNHYNMIALRADKILFIENWKNGSQIHIRNPENMGFPGMKITTDKKIKDLYEILKDYGFAYAHNSYIVNLQYITKLVENRVIILTDGSELNVSRSKLVEFRKSLREYMKNNYI